MAIELKSLSLRGYKTYRDLDNFEPGRLTVLVGGNGAGKSNLISFFRLLYRMAASPGELQLAVETAGGASKILHDGTKKTDAIWARLVLSTESGTNEYTVRLAYAAPDRLIFTEEKCSFQKQGFPKPRELDFGSAHRESMLVEKAFDGEDTARVVRNLLRKCQAYQFHDTSFTSGMRQRADLNDSLFLHSDGSNLAAFLHRLSLGNETERLAAKRIQDTARLALPFMGELVLDSPNGSLLLQWRERGTDRIFDASQASDGMLRILALTALLCQPPASLPAIILLDEPELGLHPQAIAVLASMIRQASHHAQILVATQSVPLLDEFSLSEIVVARRSERETKLDRLKEDDYTEWLKEYSAGELWRKNVIGGGPGE
jgi:predicted ATPase